MWGYSGEWGNILHEKVGDCATASHACQKGLDEELSGGEDWVWLVMEKESPHLPASDFFQKILGASRAEKALGFEGLPMKKYSLHRWEAIFQLVGSESNNNPMMSLEGIRK